jgi:hypothetical protein
MRQTLLGWQISKHQDYGCNSYRHVHIPELNTEFHLNVTAPLEGGNVSDAWRSVLKSPEFYIPTTPVSFMRPVLSGPDSRSLTDYLQRRYWTTT